MNICAIGRAFTGAPEIDFESTRTILDFDVVLIDVEGLYQGDHRHQPESIVQRRAEFVEFLELGRVVVVFSSEGRIYEFLPLESFSVNPRAGKKIDFRGPDHLKTFWGQVGTMMQYLGFFDEPPGQPFLFASDTTKAVGSILRHGLGTVLFLPFLPTGQPNYDPAFRNALKQLCAHLFPRKEVEDLPPWSTNYGWKSEQALRCGLGRLQTEAEAIAKLIVAATESLILEEQLKILFTGKGDALEEAAATVFRELGFKVTRGEPGRDDIILEFGDKKAVAEVKGRKGSAAEKDAAQLEKWVAGFVEANGESVKGILLVNAFCETPLMDRNEDAFPHQMLKYSTQREHCLITTTQLLGLLLEVRAHPERRDELVQGLFTTIGLYPEFIDWRKFLLGPHAVDSTKVS